MSNSSLVSGLSEAFGARSSWVEVSHESLKIQNKIGGHLPIEGLLKARRRPSFRGVESGSPGPRVQARSLLEPRPC